jgi:hypothetical protein
MARRINRRRAVNVIEDDIGLDDVFRNPQAVANWLETNADLYVVQSAEVVLTTYDTVVLHIAFRPLPSLAIHGYPFENVGVMIKRNGQVLTTPHADQRTWYHHNNDAFNSLCLWFPNDPQQLQWNWTDGFCSYLLVIFRHLCAEEYFRRNDKWPFEDVAHGDIDPPIRSANLKSVVRLSGEAS